MPATRLDEREKKGLALENTGSHAMRLAAIRGRVMKAELRKTAEASKRNRRK